MPDANGNYCVWRTDADLWTRSELSKNQRSFALIDPPENGLYSRAADCRVQLIASNNEERHIKNAEKDGVVLLMKVPTIDEILSMREILWTDKTPISGQNFVDDESMEEELTIRCFLIGYYIQYFKISFYQS